MTGEQLDARALAIDLPFRLKTQPAVFYLQIFIHFISTGFN